MNHPTAVKTPRRNPPTIDKTNFRSEVGDKFKDNKGDEGMPPDKEEKPKEKKGEDSKAVDIKSAKDDGIKNVDAKDKKSSDIDSKDKKKGDENVKGDIKKEDPKKGEDVKKVDDKKSVENVKKVEDPKKDDGKKNDDKKTVDNLKKEDVVKVDVKKEDSKKEGDGKKTAESAKKEDVKVDVKKEDPKKEDPKEEGDGKKTIESVKKEDVVKVDVKKVEPKKDDLPKGENPKKTLENVKVDLKNDEDLKKGDDGKKTVDSVKKEDATKVDPKNEEDKKPSSVNINNDAQKSDTKNVEGDKKEDKNKKDEEKGKDSKQESEATKKAENITQKEELKDTKKEDKKDDVKVKGGDKTDNKTSKKVEKMDEESENELKLLVQNFVEFLDNIKEDKVPYHLSKFVQRTAVVIAEDDFKTKHLTSLFSVLSIDSKESMLSKLFDFVSKSPEYYKMEGNKDVGKDALSCLTIFPALLQGISSESDIKRIKKILSSKLCSSILSFSLGFCDDPINLKYCDDALTDLNKFLLLGVVEKSSKELLLQGSDVILAIVESKKSETNIFFDLLKKCKKDTSVEVCLAVLNLLFGILLFYPAKPKIAIDTAILRAMPELKDIPTFFGYILQLLSDRPEMRDNFKSRKLRELKASIIILLCEMNSTYKESLRALTDSINTLVLGSDDMSAIETKSYIFKMYSLLKSQKSKAELDVEAASNKKKEELEMRDIVKSTGTAQDEMIGVEGTFRITVFSCKNLQVLEENTPCHVRIMLSTADDKKSRAQRSVGSSRSLREFGSLSRVWQSKDKADVTLSSPGTYAWTHIEVWTTNKKGTEKHVGNVRILLSSEINDSKEPQKKKDERWVKITSVENPSVSIGDLSISITCSKLADVNSASSLHEKEYCAKKIQSVFKGKKVRKSQGLLLRATCKIQAFWKGRQERKRHKARRKERDSIVKEEEERRKRRNRILLQQRELQLLRNLKADQVASYLDFKRNRSARIIQRSYRRYSLIHKTNMLSKARKNIMVVHGAKANFNAEDIKRLGLKVEPEGVEYEGISVPHQKVDSVRLADLHRDIMQRVMEKQAKEDLLDREQQVKSGSRIRGGHAYKVYRRLHTLQQQVLNMVAEREANASQEVMEERRLLKVQARAKILHQTLRQNYSLAQRLEFSNQKMKEIAISEDKKLVDQISDTAENHDAAKKIQGAYKRKQRRVTDLKVDTSNAEDSKNKKPKAKDKESINTVNKVSNVKEGKEVPNIIMPSIPSGVRLVEAREAHKMWYKAHKKDRKWYELFLGGKLMDIRKLRAKSNWSRNDFGGNLIEEYPGDEGLPVSKGSFDNGLTFLPDEQASEWWLYYSLGQNIEAYRNFEKASKAKDQHVSLKNRIDVSTELVLNRFYKDREMSVKLKNLEASEKEMNQAASKIQRIVRKRRDSVTSTGERRDSMMPVSLGLNKNHASKMNLNKFPEEECCQECQEAKAVLQCNECIETTRFCPKCWTVLHSTNRRIEHQPVPFVHVAGSGAKYVKQSSSNRLNDPNLSLDNFDTYSFNKKTSTTPKSTTPHAHNGFRDRSETAPVSSPSHKEKIGSPSPKNSSSTPKNNSSTTPKATNLFRQHSNTSIDKSSGVEHFSPIHSSSPTHKKSPSGDFNKPVPPLEFQKISEKPFSPNSSILDDGKSVSFQGSLSSINLASEGEITVTVNKARDLGGKKLKVINPYVKIRMNDSKISAATASVVNGGARPKWGRDEHKSVLTIPFKKTKNSSIRVEVIDQTLDSKLNPISSTEVAFVNIDIANFTRHSNQDFTTFYPLTLMNGGSAGQIQLTIRCTGKK